MWAEGRDRVVDGTVRDGGLRVGTGSGRGWRG